MAITWADVTARAPELSTVALAQQTAILEDVGVLLNESVFGDKYKMAACALAAHMATLQAQGGQGPGGPISAETAGPVSRSYAVLTPADGEAYYMSTSYGRQYWALVKTLPVRWFVT